MAQDFSTEATEDRLYAAADQQAQERMEVLVKQMNQAQGLTEQLKAENVME